MLNRFDRATRKGVLNGYFLWLIVGYAVGMCLCLRYFVLFFYCGIAYVPYSTMQFAATIIFFNDLHDGGLYSGSSKRMNFD
jgi:hypothetical protein